MHIAPVQSICLRNALQTKLEKDRRYGCVFESQAYCVGLEEKKPVRNSPPAELNPTTAGWMTGTNNVFCCC